jgi:hypothetical protein
MVANSHLWAFDTVPQTPLVNLNTSAYLPTLASPNSSNSPNAGLLGLTSSYANPRPEFLGDLSINKYNRDSTSNQFGVYGSPYSPLSINNQFGRYGSPYSPNSANHSYATNAPCPYDSGGNFRETLSTNRYDPNSMSNPYGRYGSPYSPDSINNKFGLGSRFSTDSPWNPCGRGLIIVGNDKR